MKNRLVLLFIGFVFLFSLSSVSTLAQETEISVNLPRILTGNNWISLLVKDFNPDKEIYGSALVKINPSQLNELYYKFPLLKAAYTAPPIIKKGETRIASFLRKNRAPKVIVRFPEKLKDAKFIEDIEMSFLDLGWNVLDRNLIDNIKPGKNIKSLTGADLIVDISWLKFSDPEMFSKLDKNKSYIDKISGQGKVKKAYMLFEPRKEYDKWKKDNNWEHVKYFHDSRHEQIDLNPYANRILSFMMVDERFNTNKNVVSAVFKFTNAIDGSLLGYYHIGESSEVFQINGGSRVNVSDQKYYTGEKNSRGVEIWLSFEKVSSIFQKMNNLMNDKILLSALSYIDIFLPNDAIPFAAQLNEMEDVKLSDEKIVESWSSTNTSNSSYSGGSKDRYNGYFNSRYYRGYRNSNYSGESASTSHSYGSGTTTFKDAEYIRYSDFFGYYKPLTEKFIEEIQKIQAR